MSEATHQLSIDIGGTFTDLVLRDLESGETWIGKVLTTAGDPAEGAYVGTVELLERAHANPERLRSVLHATTLATNALIERKGARAALLTTAGFRDVLEIRDESRYDLFDLFLELPEPLIPRELRFEVDERVRADGTTDRPLDVLEARRTVAALGELGVTAVAVCLLHSYRNPAHEEQLGELVEELLPDVEVSLSHEVAPEIREYPRTATTVTNVYIKRLIAQYLERLKTRLEGIGMSRDLFVMLSSGSLAAIDTAKRFPVRLIESGPAAGALGAAAYARANDARDLISFDMGGTTAKACLVRNGQPARSDQLEVDRVWRFKPGSGTPLRTPVVELIEIGAGGGSIAWVDELGRLRVGPQSAGADPGPACYANGGEMPTVTDANVVLGYLDPDEFLGGRMAIDPELAIRAIERGVADPLGIDVVHAAWGIHQMVNETMAGAARMAATERGEDPRDYPIFAFGGSGPVHAFGVAGVLDSPGLLVPLRAGVMSAVGLQCAPLAFDLVHSWVGRLDEADWSEVEELCARMEREGLAILANARIDEEQVTVSRSVDMRYVGQGYEVTVPVPTGSLALAAEALVPAFETAYRRRNGRVLKDLPLQMVNWRCTTAGPVPEPELGTVQPGAPGHAGPRAERPIFLGDRRDFGNVPVVARAQLRAGDTLRGPAIVQETESTLVVAGDAHIEVDHGGTIVVSLEQGRP